MAAVPSFNTSLPPTNSPPSARPAWDCCEYCMICGGFARVAELIDDVCQLRPNASPQEVHLSKQFSLTRADKMFQSKVVIIGPFGGDRAVLPTPAMSQEELASRFGRCDPASVRLIRGLFPPDMGMHSRGFLLGDHPDPRLQSYAPGKDGKLVKVPYRYYIASSVFFYAHATCYEMLCDFAPCFRDRPALIWQLLIESNKARIDVPGIPGIHYLEMVGPMQRRGPPLLFWHLGIKNYKDNIYDLFAKSFASHEVPGYRYDVHHDWFELAQMWIFSGPSAFPADEALHNEYDLVRLPARQSSRMARLSLDSLPVEIFYHVARYLDVKDALTLLCINTVLREKLVDCVNYYMRHCVPQWARPPATLLDRFEFAREILTFETAPFPWLSYLRECYISRGMRNRRRIWRICMQFEALALAHLRRTRRPSALKLRFS